MNARRVEVTLSRELWEKLEWRRGHEPRASFVKRALEAALQGHVLSGQALESALGGVEESEHHPLDHSAATPVRAPVDGGEFAAGEVMDPRPTRAQDIPVEVLLPPEPFEGKRPMQIPKADLMWERQQRLNKGSASRKGRK